MWRLTLRSPKQDLRDEVTFLRAQVAQLQNYILMTGGGAPTGFPTWAAPDNTTQTRGDDSGITLPMSEKAYSNEAQKLYTTEEEEDIHFALEEGLIGQDEAQRRLREVMEVANDIELM